MTNQSDRQQSARNTTFTSFNYEGDWHALFDAAFIPTGSFNGRLLQWINAQLSTSYTEINGAMAAYATSQGVSDWNSLNTATPPFTPTNISGLALWLDAADTATITQSAGAVSQWNDKSGNSRHAVQPTGSKQPITGTRTINGLNAINFDGLSHNLFFPIAALGATQPAVTIAVAYFPDTTTTTQQVVSSNGTGGAQNRTQLKNQEQDFGNLAFTSSTVVSGQTIVHVARVPAAAAGITSRMKINSLSQQTSGSFTRSITAVATAAVGSYGDGINSFFDGRIAEVLIYQREISDTEANVIGNYLASKWGATWTNI